MVTKLPITAVKEFVATPTVFCVVRSTVALLRKRAVVRIRAVVAVIAVVVANATAVPITERAKAATAVRRAGITTAVTVA